MKISRPGREIAEQRRLVGRGDHVLAAVARRLDVLAALRGERNAFAISEGSAPSVNSERNSKSMETLGSAASILAIRDWLDPIRLATASCDSFFASRVERRNPLSAALKST